MPITTVGTVAQLMLSPGCGPPAPPELPQRFSPRAAVRRRTSLRAPDASLLLDGPLGGGVRLQAPVGYGRAALDRDPEGPRREPVFGAADGGKLILQLGEASLGELVFIQV